MKVERATSRIPVRIPLDEVHKFINADTEERTVKERAKVVLADTVLNNAMHRVLDTTVRGREADISNNEMRYSVELVYELYIVSDFELIQVAAFCHEVNRLYCQFIGDPSQTDWFSTPDMIKESAVDGVRAVLEGRVKEPGDSHANWYKFKKEQGWVFGPEKCISKKTHPCMLPFEELPKEQQYKDVLFVNTAKAGLSKYTV